MSTIAPPPALRAGQVTHVIALTLLLALVGAAWDRLGHPHPLAFWTAVAFPVAHQVYVWLAWRLELASGWTSKAVGFGGYVAIFFVLFGGRFVSLIALGWLDRGSLQLPPGARVAIAALLLVPGIYAMYSVARYFGMARAAGADHFDPRVRDLPPVREGIFRFTANGMYFYAFLLFWAISILLDSSAALVVAGFSHAYIWVHFHATEKPDMAFLYGSSAE